MEKRRGENGYKSPKSIRIQDTTITTVQAVRISGCFWQYIKT